MTLLLKIIHRPCCEQFHVGTTFWATFRAPFSPIILERRQNSVADIYKTRQLTPNLSRLTNSTTGNICIFDFRVNCPFKIQCNIVLHHKNQSNKQKLKYMKVNTMRVDVSMLQISVDRSTHTRCYLTLTSFEA